MPSGRNGCGLRIKRKGQQYVRTIKLKTNRSNPSGHIVAAIWLNSNSGGKRYYTFTIDRSYRDADGNLKSAKSYSIIDTALIQIAVERAEAKIRELRSVDAATEVESDFEAIAY